MSEQFIVSARKFRPNSLASLLGQNAIRETLRQSILQKKIAHAYLFCGPRGVGKTSAARIFAKSINCENPKNDAEACGTCSCCQEFEQHSSSNIFELDAASNNSADHIRSLVEEVIYPPILGKYKIYIIDEVHMLSTAAFNAFLKTLEEPPAHVIFILATTERQKILPTILSRCQIFDFRAISNDIIKQQLQAICSSENIKAEDKALDLIANKSNGGMRDALSTFDRIASYSNNDITYNKVLECLNIIGDGDFYTLFQAIVLEKDSAKVLDKLDNFIERGFDTRVIIDGFSDFLRNLLIAFEPNTAKLLNLPPIQIQYYTELAQKTGRSIIYHALLRLQNFGKEYRYSNSKRLLAEITLLSLIPDYASNPYLQKVAAESPKEKMQQNNSERIQTPVAKAMTNIKVNPNLKPEDIIKETYSNILYEKEDTKADLQEEKTKTTVPSVKKEKIEPLPTIQKNGNPNKNQASQILSQTLDKEVKKKDNI